MPIGRFHKEGHWRKTVKGYKVWGRGDNFTIEHVQIAEKALGKKLPIGAVVHHVNEIKDDNRPENLVICPNEEYHKLLHSRMKALAACGNPNWRKCRRCKKYDDLDNLQKYKNSTKKNGFVYGHKSCEAVYSLARYHVRKGH